MGYSTSERTLLRIRSKLHRIEQGDEQQWYVREEGRNNYLAYKIREALYIAATHYPKKYPQLALAAKKFEIRISGKTAVIARLRPEMISDMTLEVQAAVDDPIVEPTTKELIAEMEDTLPTTEEESGEMMTVDGEMTDPFLVVQACMDIPSGTRIYIPEGKLNVSALTMVYKWAKKQQPPRMILAEPGEEGITIAIADPEMEEFEWKPQV
jgi:hypothetical protein